MFPQLRQLASVLAAQTPTEPMGCARGDFLLPIIMLAILYIVWMRPAGKERKAHQQMLDSLKRGDEVVTNSGIIGTVADIADRIVTVEVARNVKVRILKSAVAKRTADIPKPEEKDVKGQSPEPPPSKASKTKE